MHSLADVDVDTQLCLVLNAREQVCHLVMVVHPVHDEIREPRVFAFVRFLEQVVKELKTLLPEVVPENLKRHQCAIAAQTLCEPG